MNNSAKILFVLAAGWLTTTAFAQDRIHYTGKRIIEPCLSRWTTVSGSRST